MKPIVELLFLALLLLCAPTAALAELSDQVQADFSVVSGTVVMPINDEYIVTLDERDNLHVGDILTVINPGQKVLHPVTREVLGTIDKPVGFMELTRIQSGYSYAKVLSDGLQPSSASPLRRYEKVPARFVDTTENGSELVRLIKLNLPQFDWLDDAVGDTALLTFTLHADALEVASAQGIPLHRYEVTEDQQLVSTTASASRPQVTTPSGPKPRLLQQFANALVGAFGQTNEERFAEIDEAIIRKQQIDRKGIWLGPNLDGHPTGMTVADLDGDGRKEVAVLFDKKVLIARISAGEFTEVAEVSLSSLLQVLSIDALDLDGDGRSELYVTSIAGQRPSSLVVEYVDGEYAVTIDSVRMLLRAVRLPGEGPSLIGQRLGDIDEPFAGDVFHVTRNGDELVEEAAVPLPEELNLFNFLPFHDDQQQVNFAYLTGGDYLKVASTEGVELWESSNYFGGSEDCFSLKDNLNDEDRVPPCVQPRMVDLSNNEILVGQNDGQRMVERFRRFKRSRVVSLSWNGFAMTENWRTSTQAGYLGDFALADADNDGKDELVMAIKFQHKGLTNQARSSIVIYELE